MLQINLKRQQKRRIRGKVVRRRIMVLSPKIIEAEQKKGIRKNMGRRRKKV